MNDDNSNTSVLRGHLQQSHEDIKLHIKRESETTEKQSVIWTAKATSLLLNLYESELESLETAKKKIWQSISKKLKNYNIDVSTDQVRWKINALTKKYKRCVEIGSTCKFKYFQVMDQIYAKHNIAGSTYTISELLDSETDVLKHPPCTSMRTETKAIIELRKMRLANRLESDRTQTKIQMERQWLEYLNRQEQSRQQRDRIIERHIRLKEQELEMKRKELQFRQSVELKNIQLIEKDVVETLQTEREKCDLLKLFGLLLFYKKRMTKDHFTNNV